MTTSLVSATQSLAQTSPFDTVFGLPVHALVVHAVVVLLPLSAIGLICIVFLPTARRSLGWLVMAGLLISTGAAFVAKDSGEQLAARVGEPTRHAALGDRMPVFAGVLFAVALAWFLLARHADRAPDAETPNARSKSLFVLIIGLAATALAVANIAWVILVGDAGSRAVWADQISPASAAASQPN